MIFNQTKIINSPKVEFSYHASFLFSLCIYLKVPNFYIFIYLPLLALLSHVKRETSFSVSHCYINHCFEWLHIFLAIPFCYRNMQLSIQVFTLVIYCQHSGICFTLIIYCQHSRLEWSDLFS